jgi:hypothetical protein
MDIFNIALGTAQAIDDEHDRSMMLSGIVEAMTRVGQTEKGLEVAKDIPNENWRIWALMSIAPVLAKEGDDSYDHVLDKALKNARAVKDGYDRAWSLGKICAALIKMGRAEDGLKLFDEITVDWHLNIVVGMVAEELARSGFLEEAMMVIDQEESPEEQMTVYERIAIELVRVGEIGEALNIVNKIEDPRMRIMALKDVAIEMAVKEEP